jgi:flagellar hook-length control protein FliK
MSLNSPIAALKGPSGALSAEPAGRKSAAPGAFAEVLDQRMDRAASGQAQPAARSAAPEGAEAREEAREDREEDRDRNRDEERTASVSVPGLPVLLATATPPAASGTLQAAPADAGGKGLPASAAAAAATGAAQAEALQATAPAGAAPAPGEATPTLTHAAPALPAFEAQAAFAQGLQSAAAQPPAATTPGPAPASAELKAPLGTPAFSTEFTETVRLFAKDGVQSASLRLNPADLGQIEVQIRIVEGRAEIAIVTAPGAKEALQDALPQLREALAQAGIQLGQAEVGERRAGDPGHAGQPGGSPGQSRGGAWGRPAEAGSLNSGLDGALAPHPAQGGARSLVDTYA